MNYKFAKAVGLNTDQQATSVMISSDDPTSIFIGLLQLSCDDAFTRGRQLLSDLVDFYIEGVGEEDRTAERLKGAFAKALADLEGVEDFSICLASIQGKVLYLITQGKVGCILRRLDKISPLDSPPGQLISGFLQEGDRVFIATSTLLDNLGEDLKSTLDFPREQWEEEMGARTTVDTSQSAGLAGLIIDVEGEENLESFKPVSYKLEEQRSYDKLKRAVKDKTLLLKNLFPSSGRVRLLLSIILIIVIGLGIGLKYKISKDHEKTISFNNFLQQAQADFKESQGLKTLNPAEAASKLTSAKESLGKALVLKPSDAFALELKKQIEEASFGQRFEGVSFTEFLDLDLVKKGFRAENLSLSVGKLLVLNPEDSTLAVVDLAKKSQKILSGKERLGDAKKASINGSSAFVYSNDKGVLRIDIGSEQASSSAKLDQDWGEIVDIVGFAGNFYLLDKGNPSAGSTSSPQASSGQVWKYLAISGGYSDKRKYLNEEVKAEFGNALKMQIESSIYVLKQGGEILRFTRGAPDHFSIGGLDKGIKDPKSFYTSSEVDNLYILDSGNSRLIVLSKTGEFKAQYSGDKFGVASDLVVNEEGKKVYLLEGSKIFQMDLK